MVYRVARCSHFICVCVCVRVCVSVSVSVCVCLCQVVAHGSEQHTDSADDLRVILIFFVQQVITVMDDRDAGTVMK